MPHSEQERLFAVAPDVKVLAHCRWQADPTLAPTVVLWHGIEGSSSAAYMLSVAHKAYRDGFNVIRMNLRNCGNTEHLTPTIYHGGLTADLRAVVSELIERDGLRRLFLIGFSLGGNMVLKLAGEYADDPPPEVYAVCAISPSVDLGASADAINRPSNWIYQKNFLRRLRQKIILKQKLYPDRYDVTGVNLIHTIREFDDRFTASAHGFRDADDYYTQASAVHLLSRIRIPTLIIHAQDDPFIPFTPLRLPAVTENPYLLLLAPERGGHVAFVGAKSDQEDRFWAENRVVEFCRLTNDECRSANPERGVEGKG